MHSYNVITLPLAEYDIKKQTDYKNYKIYFAIDEPKQTVYILRVFHMLVDTKAELLKFKSLT